MNNDPTLPDELWHIFGLGLLVVAGIVVCGIAAWVQAWP
jgi:hypothetical protein